MMGGKQTLRCVTAITVSEDMTFNRDFHDSVMTLSLYIYIVLALSFSFKMPSCFSTFGNMLSFTFIYIYIILIEVYIYLTIFDYRQILKASSSVTV